ncbi:DNA-binding transcriptional LysR family regulator [Duganella sp. 1411]|jgi:DNA-binding transcriptional LysR family regulator|uniref:LysR family transcriptional regulator n=1 Tax=Duganella sp. 1411 TaxID=2806572 RepID=UPI001AE97A5A|nr:LysR family transcriptional regulator [Duganella sp. 1411]MBP1205045.1 DNA-binding transcriptional LysR family regulator [Duganella sp. 1411]
MSIPDLNLLITLDVLLTEGSVTRAAQRLRLSPSAMSRALARLRETTGDPLLVRAGRELVPTPRALELRERVGPLLGEALAVLAPARQLDPRQLEQTFTLRASDGFVENFGPALLAHIGAQAPGVRLRFVQKSDRESVLLREGSVDLETGVIGGFTSPEVRARRLFADRFVGVVRQGHALARGEIDIARYAAGQHVLVARRDQDTGPMDEALAAHGMHRTIASIVGGFTAALALAAGSDLIATVPERHTGNLRAGMFSFALPLRMPELTVSLMWHPRMDADPAHRWLRGCVVEACAGRPAAD